MWQVTLPSLVILTIASVTVFKKKSHVGRVFGAFQTWLNDEPFKEECENSATGNQSPLSTLNANRIGKGNPFYYLQYHEVEFNNLFGSTLVKRYVIALASRCVCEKTRGNNVWKSPRERKLFGFDLIHLVKKEMDDQMLHEIYFPAYVGLYDQGKCLWFKRIPVTHQEKWCERNNPEKGLVSTSNVDNHMPYFEVNREYRFDRFSTESMAPSWIMTTKFEIKFTFDVYNNSVPERSIAFVPTNTSSIIENNDLTVCIPRREIHFPNLPNLQNSRKSRNKRKRSPEMVMGQRNVTLRSRSVSEE